VLKVRMMKSSHSLRKEEKVKRKMKRSLPQDSNNLVRFIFLHNSKQHREVLPFGRRTVLQLRLKTKVYTIGGRY
jgi:hypothetical protein